MKPALSKLIKTIFHTALLTAAIFSSAYIYADEVAQDEQQTTEEAEPECD